VPTCTDALQNQGETAVDCGGAICVPCSCTFGTAQPLSNVNVSGSSVWSPTLSSDGLTMYLSLSPSGFNERIGVATRPDRGDTFGSVSSLPSPVNSVIAGTPELSQDGLSLYFFSERFGGTGGRDLYVATRPSLGVEFNAVSEPSTLNSVGRDDRPWLSPDELSVYFSSQRASISDDLWRATRNGRSDAFGPPVVAAELNSIGNDAGVFLTPDGKVAFLASDRSGGLGGLDLYRAVRASTGESFSTPEILVELSSSADDFDPQLTADGQELFFVSKRSSADFRIWRSSVSCP
jgi:Tol biopolymer transport system component